MKLLKRRKNARIGFLADWKNNRGVSILVSLVLSVALLVAVSLAVYFFYFKQTIKSVDYSEKIYTQSRVCGNINLKINSACYRENGDDSIIKLSLMNDGNIPINGGFLLVQIIMNEKLVDVVPTIPYTNVQPFEQTETEVFYDSKPDAVRIIPRVVQGDAIFCAQNLKSKDVDLC